MAAIRQLLIKFIRWLALGERGGICRSVQGRNNVFRRREPVSAVVTKLFDLGVILGGNPASVIKSDISWKRERLPL